MRLLVIVANVKERKNILNPQNLIFLSLFEASTTAALSVRCSKKFHSQVTPSKSLSQAHAFAKHDWTVMPSLRSDYHNTGWGGGVDCDAAWRHLGHSTTDRTSLGKFYTRPPLIFMKLGQSVSPLYDVIANTSIWLWPYITYWHWRSSVQTAPGAFQVT